MTSESPIGQDLNSDGLDFLTRHIYDKSCQLVGLSTYPNEKKIHHTETVYFYIQTQSIHSTSILVVHTVYEVHTLVSHLVSHWQVLTVEMANSVSL